MVDGGAELHALVVAAADEGAFCGDEGSADLLEGQQEGEGWVSMVRSLSFGVERTGGGERNMSS